MRAALLSILLCASSCTDTEPEQPARPAPSGTETLYGLRPGPGRDHVLGNCLPCHSGAIIASNHLTRDGWSEVIDTMQNKNGMHQISADVREAILDYLETAQRPDDPGLAQGKTSPWATPLYRPNPLWK